MQYLGMSPICLHTKFLVPNFKGTLVVNLKPKIWKKSNGRTLYKNTVLRRAACFSLRLLSSSFQALNVKGVAAARASNAHSPHCWYMM